MIGETNGGIEERPKPRQTLRRRPLPISCATVLTAVAIPSVRSVRRPVAMLMFLRVSKVTFRGRWRQISLVVFSRENAASQRRPRQDAHSHFERHGDEGSRSTVRSVQAYRRSEERRAAPQPRSSANRLHPRGLPGRRVRNSDMHDLSGPDEIIEAAQDLLDRRAAIPDMQIEQVRCSRSAGA